MMQNSRRKKKASQQKKRYHDRTKGKSGSVDAAAPAIAKGLLLEVSKISTPQSVETEQIKPEENQTGTNLDRYEDSCGDGIAAELYKESEELSQQRLVQLLNLPIHHTPLTTQPLTTVTSSTGTTSCSPFLTLDCSALAESLSSLPLHTTLNISLDLLELSKLPPVDNMGMRASETLLCREPPATAIDLDVCSKQSHRCVFEFDKMSPSLWLLGERENDGQHGGLRDAPMSEKIKTIPMKSDSGLLTETNVELDKLLERSLLVKERIIMDKIGGDTAAGITVEEVVSAVPGRGSTAAATNTEDTDELDDILDELLS